MKLGGLVIVATVLSLLPRVAHACPVCFSAQNEENRFAFVAMTVFLTLLPLAMLGLGLGWVWRRMRLLEGSGKDSNPVGAPAPSASRSSTGRA